MRSKKLYIPPLFLALFGIMFCVTDASAQDDRQPVAPAAAASAAEPDEPRFTLNFNATELSRVLGFLELKGFTVILRGNIQDNVPVSITARDETAETILQKLVGPRDWVWYKNPETGTYEIWDKQTYEQEVVAGLMIDKTFTLEFVRAQDILPAVQGIINQDKGASVSVDDRTNKLFVRDLPEVLQQIARLIEELDVNLVTRVFRIRHAEVEELAEKLAVHKSDPGTIDPDIRTHQIFVVDTEANIRRMELLVEALDVGPELRVYDLNTIGFEGEDTEELLSALERVITPDAFYEINYRTANLIVEDVEEVHDLIEQVLRAFDQPIKQVLIELEILETNFSSDFDYNMDITFSEDLFSAAADGSTTTATDADGETNTSVSASQLPGGAAIETGSLFPEVIDQLGFLNFREEFPIVSASGAGLSALNLSSRARIVFQAAIQDSETQVLQQPRLLVKNHATATIEVGVEEPFANTLPTTGNSNRLLTSIQTVRAGLFVELRPSISNNGLVEMEVIFEDNDAQSVIIQSDGQDVTAVRRLTRELSTELIIPSGETRVIGGLLRNDRIETNSGVPLIQKIPYIGPYIFGRISKDDQQRHIMIFLTPTIVDEKPQTDQVYSRTATFEEMREFENRPLEEISEEEGLEEGLLSDDASRGRSLKDPGDETQGEIDLSDFELPEESQFEKAEDDAIGRLVEEELEADESLRAEDGYDDIFGELGIEPARGESEARETAPVGTGALLDLPIKDEYEYQLNDAGTSPSARAAQPSAFDGGATRASHLLKPGKLADDSSMLDTLAEDADASIAPDTVRTNYTIQQRGPGSTSASGGGPRPSGGRPSAAPAQGGAPGQTTGRQPGGRPGGQRPPTVAGGSGNNAGGQAGRSPSGQPLVRVQSPPQVGTPITPPETQYRQ